MRSVTIHAVLLAVALVGAYLVWTEAPEDPAAATAVTLLDVEAEDVQAVRYDAEKLHVVLTPKTDDHGHYAWVEVDRTIERAAPPKPKAAGDEGAQADDAAKPREGAKGEGASDDDHAAASKGENAEGAAAKGDGAASQAQGGDGTDAGAKGGETQDDAAAGKDDMIVERKQLAFKGNASADKLLAAVAPFRAKRKLGAEVADLAELGLDEPGATLTVVTASGEHTYELGQTVFGGDSRYLRDTSDGQIYLVDARVLRPLMSAQTSLVDRALFPGSLADIDEVEVEGAPGTVRLVQHNRADRQAAYWSIGPDGERSEPAQAWLRKLMRARVQSFLAGEPDTVGVELSAPVLTLTIRGEDGTHQVRIYKGPPPPDEQNAPAATPGASEPEAWYARSTYSRGWVRLYKTQAADVAHDLDSLFPAGGGEATGDGAEP